MNTPQSVRQPARPRTVSRPRTQARPPTVTPADAEPRTTPSSDLRALLEANLAALHSILEEHQRTLDANLRAVDGIRAELRAELRALGDARAPWVKALADTRALLYVALHETIVNQDAAATLAWRNGELERVEATHPTRGVRR
jgi:hypothetical protein